MDSVFVEIGELGPYQLKVRKKSATSPHLNQKHEILQ